MSLSQLLAHHIRQHGAIKTARVSSAQASGAAKMYPYWGAVRYQIRLTADGQPSNITRGRASSDRRSTRLVEQDCDAICESEQRLRVQSIGRLDAYDTRLVLESLGYSDALARHAERVRKSLPPLTLQQRLLGHLARKAGLRATESDVREGKLGRDGRHITLGWQQGYLPYGDERDTAEFARASNQERRRRILAACGDRVLPAAELVQMDDYGRLYETWDGRQSVHVVCPSTGAQYVLPVSDRVRTAKEAVAETFGMSAVEYQPAAEA